MLQSQTLQAQRIQLASVVAVGMRRVELDPEVPVTRATSGDGWGSDQRQEGHLEPTAQDRHPDPSVSLPSHATITLPHPHCLLPDCLSAPPAGPTPRASPPQLPPWFLSSLRRPNSMLPGSIACPPSLPPILNTVNFAATGSASPCPRLNSSGLEGSGLR